MLSSKEDIHLAKKDPGQVTLAKGSKKPRPKLLGELFRREERQDELIGRHLWDRQAACHGVMIVK